MEQFRAAWRALSYGGVMVYPLLALGILAMMIILDRTIVCARALRLPGPLLELLESYGFDWEELTWQVKDLGPHNAYGSFF